MLEHPTVMSLKALIYRSTFSYETECSSCNVTFESDNFELLSELEYQCVSILEMKGDENNPFHFYVANPKNIETVEEIWNNIVSNYKITVPP